MHSIRLDIKDSVFDKVIYFLKNLPNDEVKIVEELEESCTLDTKAYSNHSANLVEDWEEEDKIDAFGVLKNTNIDPVKWQEELRRENDSSH